MKLNKVFGNNVKYFRFRKKYTQEKVAELTDTSVTYISQLELDVYKRQIIGISDNTNIVSSDIRAIIEYTNNYYILNDLEYAKISANSIIIYDNKGNVLQKDINVYKDENISNSKGHYKHYMLKEIMEQKETIYNTVKTYIDNIDTLLTPVSYTHIFIY